ncbi:MAG TPA: HypC/HybG/HupF family hydrogenase formation chaperone [Verrucomicrobiae bacterium]|nr:HypC/HybG/HupF family hydrogenase formation chaperone [Verrucomicrobiae bacterium]
MCLAVPGQLIDFEDIGGIRLGRVRFGGITRQACLDFVPEAQMGDYVLVHVGFAISRVDGEEAARTFRILQEMGLLEEELGGAYPAEIPAAPYT